MGGGVGNSQSKISNWSGYSKKRCTNIGCKKRVRHILKENNKGYCIFCFNNYSLEELLNATN